MYRIGTKGYLYLRDLAISIQYSKILFYRQNILLAYGLRSRLPPVESRTQKKKKVNLVIIVPGIKNLKMPLSYPRLQ